MAQSLTPADVKNGQASASTCGRPLLAINNDTVDRGRSYGEGCIKPWREESFPGLYEDVGGSNVFHSARYGLFNEIPL